MKNVILGTLCGAIVYFMWSFFFWVFSGIPVNHAKTFADEAAVQKCLTEQAKEGSGYYILPTPKLPAGVDAKTYMETRPKQIQSTFFFAGAVHTKGTGVPLTTQIAMSFGWNLVTALFLTLLVIKADGETFFDRFSIVLLAIAAGTTGIYVMQHVWWGVTPPWVCYLMLDWVVGWSLAGLAIAKLTAP